MKKQTAVEWFFEQLTEVDYGCINKTFLQNNNSLAGHKLRELFDQAKAMEKEQMFAFTRHYHIIGEATNVFYKHEFEQYYNETYNK